MNITYIYLALYFVGLAIITWRSSRGQSASEYLNSSKLLSVNDSTWTTFASLLTGYNFVLGVTFSFLYGFWYLMAFIGAGCAFVVLYFFYKKRLASMQNEHNLFSWGDYFGVEYNRFTKIFVNAIFCVCLILFLTLQMYVNTGLFSTLLDISKEWSLIIIAGIVCIYLWFGGFKASVKTDIFQGALMLPIILTVFVFPTNFSFDKIPSAFELNQIWFAIGLALLQFLSLMAQPESFQRIFAIRDVSSLKKSLKRSFVLLALVAGAVAYLGINLKFGGASIDPSSLFTNAILISLPQWLGSLLIVSLIAAFMGTIDSSSFALGTLLSKFRAQPSHAAVKQIRIYTLAGIVISAIASLYLFSFLSSFFALISLISIIGLAVLASLIIKMTASEINTFLLVGVITFIFGMIFDFITDNPLTSLIPSAAGLVAFLVFRFTLRKSILLPFG